MWLQKTPAHNDWSHSAPLCFPSSLPLPLPLLSSAPNPPSCVFPQVMTFVPWEKELTGRECSLPTSVPIFPPGIRNRPCSWLRPAPPLDTRSHPLPPEGTAAVILLLPPHCHVRSYTDLSHQREHVHDFSHIKKTTKISARVPGKFSGE